MDVNVIGSGTKQGAVQRPEQLRYATLLERGAWLGMVMLAITYVVYALELMPADIAPARWPSLWDKPVRTYIEMTGAPTGWGWLRKLDKSDYAGLSGVAVLAGCSILSVFALIPMYWKRRDRAFALIAVLQVLVLLLAASGILAAVH